MKLSNCLYLSLRHSSEEKLRSLVKNLGGASVVIVDGTNALIQLPSADAEPYIKKVTGSMLVKRAAFCPTFIID